MSSAKANVVESPSSRQGSQDIESYIKQTVDIGLEIEEVKVETKKELHNKRIEDLRSLLTEIAKDNWKYQSVPNILGIPEE